MWRSVERVRIDGRYEVGSDGVVYSGGLPLKAVRGTWVSIHGERRSVAYLVARAFVPNAEGRKYVVHRNGDRTDNRAANLEWSDREEAGRRRGPKRREGTVVRIGEDGDVKRYPSVSYAAADCGLSERNIRSALYRGGRSGGYAWRWL